MFTIIIMRKKEKKVKKDNEKALNPIVRETARYYHSKFNEINNMTCHNLDELCEKADKMGELEKSFNALPQWLREAVGNTKESQLY